MEGPVKLEILTEHGLPLKDGQFIGFIGFIDKKGKSHIYKLFEVNNKGEVLNGSVQQVQS